MDSVVLRLIVLGEIPGTETRIGFNGALTLAGTAFVFVVTNIIMLYIHRKSIKQLLRTAYNSYLESITI